MAKITTASEDCISLIKKYEGFYSKPYLCPAKIPTIGYGNTFYENGKKVTLADPEITMERAVQLLKFTLKSFEQYVDSYCRDDISQHQFDALTSFCYNLGPQNLKTSTLLKKVNTNPLDASIAAEFKKWNKAGGKVLQGLVKRRASESELYFKS
jgi:lysozyme